MIETQRTIPSIVGRLEKHEKLAQADSIPEAPTMIGIKLHAKINKLILSLSSYIV